MKLLDEIKDQITKKLGDKSKNYLIYDPKYKLKEFNNIPSIDSKFEMIEKCYKDYINLINVDVEPENIK